MLNHNFPKHYILEVNLDEEQRADYERCLETIQINSLDPTLDKGTLEWLGKMAAWYAEGLK